MSKIEQEAGFELLLHPNRDWRSLSDTPGGGYQITPLVALWVLLHTPNPAAPGSVPGQLYFTATILYFYFVYIFILFIFLYCLYFL